MVFAVNVSFCLNLQEEEVVLMADARAEERVRKAEAKLRKQREQEVKDAEKDAAEMAHLMANDPEVGFLLKPPSLSLFLSIVFPQQSFSSTFSLPMQAQGVGIVRQDSTDASDVSQQLRYLAVNTSLSLA